MGTYRKKSTVEAEQFFERGHHPVGVCTGGESCRARGTPEGACPHVHTLEGSLVIRDRDWVLTGVDGEKWPCKDDIFTRTYEPALAAPDGPLNYLLSQVTGTEAYASVIAERGKQVVQWGYSHDDKREADELAQAAGVLALKDMEFHLELWPVLLRNRHANDRRKQLVIAAALLLAEIERMDRKPTIPWFTPDPNNPDRNHR